MFDKIFGNWKTTLVGVLVIVTFALLLWFDKVTPLQSGIGLVGILLFFFNDEKFEKIFNKFLKK